MIVSLSARLLRLLPAARCSGSLNSMLLGAFIGLSFSLAMPASAGGLPASVDGEPLPSLAPMLERITPAVVNISGRGATESSNPLRDDPFFQHFFDLPRFAQPRDMQSLGSGVIVDAAQGLAVTNHHVIADAEEILVTLTDGREFTASVIGEDPDADIAVIKIAAKDLIELRWADSDQLRVGDFVVAIGNPFGLGQTVTSGIVSALGRSGLGIEEIEDFIQTDASINPGNSGGALVNLRGDLIGINTAIVGPSGGNVGIGFAIPSNLASDLMQQLVSEGEVRRGKLGVSLQVLTEDLQEIFGVRKGVVISEVQNDSPADLAGLLRGDVLTEIDGRKVTSVNEVKNAIGLLRVGEQIEVKFVRDKQSSSAQLNVGESDQTEVDGEDLAQHLAGAVFENGLLGRQPVVVVSGVQRGSQMARYGFRRGDLVRSVNRMDVQNVEEMIDAVSLQTGKTLLDVQRGNSVQTVLVQ